MNIIQRLDETLQSRQQSAAEQYRALMVRVANGGEPSERDVELLERLSAELGRAPADVDADLKALRRMVELKPLAAEQDARHKEYRNAHQSLADHEKYWASEVQRLGEERDALEQAKRRAQTAWTESIEANKEIHSLMQRSHHLFD